MCRLRATWQSRPEFFHVGRNDCARRGVFLQTLARNLNDPRGREMSYTSRSMEILMAAAQPDAIALLKADHRKVEDLFAKFEAARERDNKKRLAKQICTELTVHTILGEEIFYPACNGKIEDDLVREAYVEHDGPRC
jgi:hypothetical protein